MNICFLSRGTGGGGEGQLPVNAKYIHVHPPFIGRIADF